VCATTISQKSLFFEEIKKSYNSLAKLTNRERTPKLLKLEQKGDITTDTTEHQWISTE
jgi:hypothetical protein